MIQESNLKERDHVHAAKTHVIENAATDQDQGAKTDTTTGILHVDTEMPAVQTQGTATVFGNVQGLMMRDVTAGTARDLGQIMKMIEGGEESHQGDRCLSS